MKARENLTISLQIQLQATYLPTTKMMMMMITGMLWSYLIPVFFIHEIILKAILKQQQLHRFNGEWIKLIKHVLARTEKMQGRHVESSDMGKAILCQLSTIT